MFSFRATNEQGRVDDVLSGSSHEMLQERSGGASPLRAGTYKLCWETGAYFQRRGHKTFFPYVEVCELLIRFPIDLGYFFSQIN